MTVNKVVNLPSKEKIETEEKGGKEILEGEEKRLIVFATFSNVNMQTSFSLVLTMPLGNES